MNNFTVPQVTVVVGGLWDDVIQQVGVPENAIPETVIPENEIDTTVPNIPKNTIQNNRVIWWIVGIILLLALLTSK